MIDSDHSITLRDTVLHTSVNYFTYTVSGLRDYGNTTLSIYVTAYNAVGSRTSPHLYIAANFAEDLRPQNEDKGANTAPIVWSVVGGFVTTTIVLILVALSFYCYKLKSKKRNNNSEHVNT